MLDGAEFNRMRRCFSHARNSLMGYKIGPIKASARMAKTASRAPIIDSPAPGPTYPSCKIALSGSTGSPIPKMEKRLRT